jgi:multicomponent Na+:H+ antiporter subunit D
MIEHLPAYQIVLPLVAAPACVLIRNKTVVRLLAIAVVWTGLAISLSLLAQVRAYGPIHYNLGGWSPAVGIEYAIDHLNAYVLLIVSMIAAVVLPVGPGTAAENIPEGKEYLFYAAFLLCITGLLGISITGDAFNVFVFLEITSLSSYTLIALGKGRKALTAAFSYLIMGTIGGTFLLLGIGLMYQLTGTLNMAVLHEALPAIDDANRTKAVAFGFLFVGSAIKLAVFPLHQWLPNAYTYAPSTVSAFLAATATKVSYYVMVRVSFYLFGAAYVFDHLHADRLLMPMALLAIFFGSLAAIFQADVKRLLAYSSIAQIGYMVLGFSFNSVNGLTGGILHLFNHALMKGGLFLVVACVVAQIGSSRVDDWAGLGKRMPLTMAAFVVGGLGLIGVPVTVGFVSKWYLVLGALEQGHFLVASAVLVGSLLAVLYVWRLVETIYFKEPADPSKCEAPWSMLGPTWVLLAASIYFGLQTEFSVGVARAAAEAMSPGFMP